MCPVLPAPENGITSYSEDSSPLGFMEMATYSCNPGFGLSGGNRVRTCTGAAGSSEEWNGTTPTCQGTYKALTVNSNKSFLGTLYSSAISCHTITPPVNGQVSFSSGTTSTHFFGTVATFSCTSGFGLLGNMTRVCGGNGSSSSGVWSGSPPICIGIYKATVLLYST